MATDHDEARRRFTVVRAAPASPTPQRSSNTEAAARYRARRRGEDVPKRKPGPKPPTSTQQRQRIRDLEARVAELELNLRITQERLSRRLSTLTTEQAARDMLAVLQRDDPCLDTPERRLILRDLAVEIEDRHQHWEE